MKILNLYAGIGRNRKLWGDSHEITAVEYKHEIAKIYIEHFPNDMVVLDDAHDYLLKHYKEFDFIWSSPPCPSHSRIRYTMSEVNKKEGSGLVAHKAIYPSMKLYEEILFLQGYFKGKWCVENVIAWYEPLIRPTEFGGHWFWTNFLLRTYEGGDRAHDKGIAALEERKGFDLKDYKGVDKRLLLRNCVEPELGKHILDLAINPIQVQSSIF